MSDSNIKPYDNQISSGDAEPVNISVFTHQGENHDAPGKTFRLPPDGVLQKSTQGRYKHLKLETKSVTNMGELALIIEGIGSSSHFTGGVCQHPVADCIPVHEREKVGTVSDLPAISRSNDFLQFTNAPGLMVIDTDTVGVDVDAELGSVFDVMQYERLKKRSTSSGIENLNGEVLRGDEGQHTMFFAKDASDIPRALTALDKRLILNKFMHPFISESGTFYARSCVDLAMAVPAQPIYIKAYLEGNIHQDLSVQVFKGTHLLDTKALIHDLDILEEAQYKEIVFDAEKEMQVEIDIAKAKHREAVVLRDKGRGIDSETSLGQLDAIINNQTLLQDATIETIEGDVLVADILANPKKYHGMTCRDPEEPDYHDGDYGVAKIFSDQDLPYINSMAHHGRKYRLMMMSFTPVLNVKGEVLPGEQKYFEVPEHPVEWWCDPKNQDDVLFDALSYCSSSATEKAIQHIAHITADQNENKMGVTALRDRLKELRRQQRVQDISIGWADVDDLGRPKGTKENVHILMQLGRITLFHNTMKHSIEATGVPMYGSSIEKNIRLHMEDIAIKHDMYPYKKASELAELMAEGNHYHPFDVYLDSLPDAWDGVDRVRELLRSMTLVHDADTSEEEYFSTSLVFLTKWLVSFIAAIRRKAGADSLRLTLVLLGDQNIGKSTFFQKLFPTEEYFIEAGDMNIRDKDSIIKVTKYLCAELGEVEEALHKNSSGLFKSFLTRDYDEFRAPYDRTDTKHRRQTVFCASDNKTHILVDVTGNTRIAPIHVKSFDFAAGNAVDRNQLWSQILHLFNTGYGWTLSDDEMEKLNLRNDTHMAETPAMDIIREAYDLSLPEWLGLREWKVMSQIIKELEIDKSAKVNSRYYNNIKEALKCVLGDTGVRVNTHRKTQEYLLPPSQNYPVEPQPSFRALADVNK